MENFKPFKGIRRLTNAAIITTMLAFGARTANAEDTARFIQQCNATAEGETFSAAINYSIEDNTLRIDPGGIYWLGEVDGIKSSPNGDSPAEGIDPETGNPVAVPYQLNANNNEGSLSLGENGSLMNLRGISCITVDAEG